MQTRPDLGDPDPSHPDKEVISMYNSSSDNVGNPSPTDHTIKSTVMTRLQQRKRAATLKPKEQTSIDIQKVNNL